MSTAGAAGSGAADGRHPWLLVIDTATSRVVVAAAALDGTLLGLTTWPAGRTHGAALLPAIGRLTGENNLRRSRIRGVIVGTGPGAFTGLRVGLATAKAIAHELAVPIAGVSTAEALLAAAAASEAFDGGAPVDAGSLVLLLPAGPNDRHVVRAGSPAVLLPGGSEPELRAGDLLIAVDLEDRAPADAVARGELARAGLAVALAALGTARLEHGLVRSGPSGEEAIGPGDDLARLVPEYVSLPRGVHAESGEVAWSRDRR